MRAQQFQTYYSYRKFEIEMSLNAINKNINK